MLCLKCSLVSLLCEEGHYLRANLVKNANLGESSDPHLQPGSLSDLLYGDDISPSTLPHEDSQPSRNHDILQAPEGGEVQHPHNHPLLATNFLTGTPEGRIATAQLPSSAYSSSALEMHGTYH